MRVNPAVITALGSLSKDVFKLLSDAPPPGGGTPHIKGEDARRLA